MATLAGQAIFFCSHTALTLTLVHLLSAYEHEYELNHTCIVIIHRDTQEK